MEALKCLGAMTTLPHHAVLFLEYFFSGFVFTFSGFCFCFFQLCYLLFSILYFPAGLSL